jgi:hypothetical protein
MAEKDVDYFKGTTVCDVGSSVFTEYYEYMKKLFGRTGVRIFLIPAGLRGFCLHQNVQTGSETHPAFSSDDTRILFWW